MKGVLPGSDGERAFTLMEIMAAVFMLGVLLMPLLTIRERATGRVERAHARLRALVHAENLLSRHLRDTDELLDDEGLVEEDPFFRYEATFEDWDLDTGLPAEDDDELDDRGLFGENAPADAGVPPDEAEDFTFHEVRRFEIEIFWPHADRADDEESLRVEGFLPRVPEVSSLFDDRRR